MSSPDDVEGVEAADNTAVSTRRRSSGELFRAALFLLPAAVLLGGLVVYPIVATVVRSLFDRGGSEFVGLGNYADALSSPRTLRALRNNVIWVVVAPATVTFVGLVFAVLTERIRWVTAFKLIVFMPMAISFLAAGVIFRLVYEAAPERGVANAVVTTIGDTFTGGRGQYDGARSRDPSALAPRNGGFVATSSASPGDVVLMPLVALPIGDLPDDATDAAAPDIGRGQVTGLVWLDFRRGGGGEPGRVDDGERGLPGIEVRAVDADGAVVGTATTAADGSFAVEVDGPVELRLAPEPFAEPFRGIEWLGPTLVTPSIIGAYLWIWAGFAMVLVGAGLAAIPRDAIEAARVDGATEWQVFRRVTVPLLAPVLIVVLVTLVINVLKVFDLVFVIPSGSVQDDANVLALEMWRVSFGGAQHQGLGSALGVLLFLLVLPAIVFNIRRFRNER